MKRSFSVAILLLFLVTLTTLAWSQTGKGKAPAGGGGGNAAALYKQHCAKCHLADGKGLASLEPPDFTNAAWQAKHTDKQIADAIRDGKETMPPYKDKLSAAQITSLVKHVRSFAAKK